MSSTCTSDPTARRGRPPRDTSPRATALREAFPQDMNRRAALAAELGISPSHLRKIINQGKHVSLGVGIALAERSGLALETVLGRRIPRGLKIWAE